MLGVQDHLKTMMKTFNVGADCPVFKGMYQYIQVGPSSSSIKWAMAQQHTAPACMHYIASCHFCTRPASCA